MAKCLSNDVMCHIIAIIVCQVLAFGAIVNGVKNKSQFFKSWTSTNINAARDAPRGERKTKLLSLISSSILV